KYFSNLISQTTEPPAPQHPGQSPRNVEEGRIIDPSSDKARGNLETATSQTSTPQKRQNPAKKLSRGSYD
ncbi:MAG: hypothetical protein PHD19_15650, partial [Dechloromonas sp.]|nr:hypothetical protein [Dechloromonas sp.]